MKFNYNEIGTTSEYGLRWYQTESGTYPSITTVLSSTQPEQERKSLENWRDSVGHEEAARISKIATDHGTLVHLLIERFFKQEDVFADVDSVPVPREAIQAFNTLKGELKKVTSVWGQEAPLYSQSLKVAGRCDLVGEYKGVPCIVDFKTSSRIKSKSDIRSYELQLLFYATAHNEMFGTNIQRGVILMAVKTGFPLEFIVDFNDELRDELCKKVQQFYSSFNDKYKI